MTAEPPTPDASSMQEIYWKHKTCIDESRKNCCCVSIKCSLVSDDPGLLVFLPGNLKVMENNDVSSVDDVHGSSSKINWDTEPLFRFCRC